jgi:hypothetical protein
MKTHSEVLVSLHVCLYDRIYCITETIAESVGSYYPMINLPLCMIESLLNQLLQPLLTSAHCPLKCPAKPLHTALRNPRKLPC